MNPTLIDLDLVQRERVWQTWERRRRHVGQCLQAMATIAAREMKMSERNISKIAGISRTHVQEARQYDECLSRLIFSYQKFYKRWYLRSLCRGSHNAKHGQPWLPLTVDDEKIRRRERTGKKSVVS